MRIVLAKKMSPNNINLAYVKGEKIRSDDVIQFKDMAGEVQDNQLPIFTEARETQTVAYIGSTTQVNLVNDIINPRVTTEYNFIQETAEIIPLWHKYTLKGIHFNNSGQKKTFAITSAEIDTPYQILANKSPVLVCVNSIQVNDINGGAPGTVLEKNVDYIYNNGDRTLTILNSILLNRKLAVTFYVINNSIIIADDLGNEIQKKYIRIEPRKFEITPSDAQDKFGDVGATGLTDLPNMYDIDILFANVLEPGLSYFVDYLRYNQDTEKTDSNTEIINTQSLYTKVTELLGTHDFDSRVFTVDTTPSNMEYPIYTKIPVKWPKVFVLYPTDKNNRLTIVEPNDVPHDLPWFIEVSNEKLVSNNLTYRPIEKITQGIIKDEFQVDNVVEDIIKLDDTTIKTQYNNLYVTYDNSGNTANITIINDGIDLTNQIDWVDNARGIIKLKTAVDVVQKNNSISYSRYIYNVQYKNINVNPYMIYNNTNSAILDKFVMIFMLPLEELDESKGRSIFHTIIYKNPERYDDVKDHQLSVENAISFIKGESYLGHEFLYDEIGEYLNSSISRGDTLHPLILGYISSSNITTPSGLEFIDIRRRGGGIKVETQINELYAGEERHYLDISKLDGYNYNLANVAVVKIKTTVRERIEIILSKYDPYAQRQIRNSNENFDITKYAESYIETIVRKYLNAACHVTILYEE